MWTFKSSAFQLNGLIYNINNSTQTSYLSGKSDSVLVSRSVQAACNLADDCSHLLPCSHEASNRFQADYLSPETTSDIYFWEPLASSVFPQEFLPTILHEVRAIDNLYAFEKNMRYL